MAVNSSARRTVRKRFELNKNRESAELTGRPEIDFSGSFGGLSSNKELLTSKLAVAQLDLTQKATKGTKGILLKPLSGELQDVNFLWVLCVLS
jgi:hypothetical protein